MIIINTTFHVTHEETDRFLRWIKEEYIPRATKSCDLSRPHMAKVITSDDEGVSYALKFHTESTAVLHRWYRDSGGVLMEEMTQLFGQKVAGFTTLLEEIDL